MKRSLWTLLFLTGLGSFDKSLAQTVSFNFSNSPNSVSGWINMHGDPSLAVITATDGTTGISISSVSTANWVQYNHANAAYDGGGETNGTFFPAAVMVDQWFQYNPAGSGTAYYNQAIPQLIISGLSIDSLYTVKISCSNALGFDSDPSHYTIVGATVYGPVDLNTQYNTANGATFTNIAPDSAGHIKVYVNTISNTEVADISGLQLIATRTPVPTPDVRITNPDNNDIIGDDGNIVIRATASETGGSVTKVEFYAGLTKIGESSSAPYTATWVNPDEGHYTLTARAIDAAGVTNTSIIQVNVQSLNYFWSTTGNIATNGDSSFVGTVDTNRLSFRTNNVERMTILNDGTIGIGTKNTYGYLLAVNGTAIFTKAKIKTTGTWPDYVFKKEYVLPELGDVEKYVIEHHHLSGIASEQEVQRDGIDVGDHQAAVLKKVEELTLYLIRQNKTIEEQNRQMAEQNAHLQELQKEVNELKAKLKAKN
jgi:hypothetical protein